MTDEAEANRSDGRPKKSARYSLQHQGGENERKSRFKRNDGRTDCPKGGAGHDQRSLRADDIQQFAAGDLTEQARETARSQDEADIVLRPFLVGEISGHVGAEPGRNTGNEKVDSVEATKTCMRRRGPCGGQ